MYMIVKEKNGMYNVYGLGKRIAVFRKKAGLTQEELAEKLNITGQAVSKWENEISFPDVTCLPEIALVLNTTMEKLFGNEDAQRIRPDPSTVFPKSKGGNMRLAHVYEATACYSEKETDDIAGEKVIFKDGSVANLRDWTIVNKGSGEIVFDFYEGLQSYGDIDFTQTELNEAFDNVDSFELTIQSADFSLTRSSDRKTHIKATGSPYFINGLKMEKKGQTLVVKCIQSGSNDSNQNRSNNLTISLGQETGKTITGTFNGSGDIDIDVSFEQGSLTINGSGSIEIKDMDAFEGKINGSGDISCGKIGNTKISINGSGDFDCKEVYGSFSASVNGSGDITVKKGEVQTFDIVIRGSGDVEASGVTTNIAKMSVSGSGDIVIGRVIEESVEKHSKNSSIKVLKRG